MDEQSLRKLFKVFNHFMLLMWRLGLGRWINFWPEGIGCIMVLTHRGRKSGLQRRTPVNYALADGDIYCVAAFGQKTDWFRNIQADPQVQVWLPEGWWAGEAHRVEDSPERLGIIRQVLINSGFAASTFEGIHPRQLTEAQIAKVTADYQLVRIHCAREITGPTAPADLVWVWPLAVHGVLLAGILWLFFKRRK